ncbi:class I SAM-dependent methyltransferase [candidate division WOR-3 bacterium]|nr:class I SAM-dependent methyltransferase [candidate division WOR-3 bacterium]
MAKIPFWIEQALINISDKVNIDYSVYLKKVHGISKPRKYPDAPWTNSVLKTQKEVDRAVSQVKKLGLKVRGDLPKNWDSLATLDYVLKNTDKEARIFDAGAALYSVVLPWLFLYGYKNLVGGNVIFKTKIKRGPILYEPCDITRTHYENNSFDAVTCLSVIEHGVNLSSYFKEMSRILKEGGILITSTDYYETPIDTKGQIAYGVPVHIFTKEEIEEALDISKKYGLFLTSPLDLTSEEKVVCWKQYDLRFTFLNFVLQKRS